MTTSRTPQIIATLGLDFQPAIRSVHDLRKEITSLEKQLTHLGERTKKTAKDIAEQTLANDLTQTHSRVRDYFFAQEQRNFDKHLEKLKSKQKLSAQDRLSLETQYYLKAEQQTRQFMQRHMRGIDEFASQIDRRLGWFVAGIAMYGSGAVFSQMLDQIGQIEMGMTQIARITEDPAADFWKMRDELFQLGIDYGQSMQTVQDIALRWAQAGYNVRDSLELTRVSLLALNSAELDATQATQSLVGIMAQWGLQASDLELVLDKINKTADDYAVSSQDLVDGLLRSSGAARVLGLSLDETIAILTVMREASGRTGREVGNALNSILSFMQRDIAIKAFDASGIKLWADEARTQFRNVRDIIGEVAAKWPTLSEATREMFVQAADEAGLYSEEMAEAVGIQKEWNDLQQRDLSQAMAGIYRRTYLLALLSNWSRVQEVLNNMTDAAGYSLRENARTMETYQKRVESLRTALQQLAWEIGEAGLLRMMKNLVDGTKAAVIWFSQLPPVVQDLTVSFTGLLGTLTLLQFGLRSLFGVGVGAGIATLIQRIRDLSGVIKASGLLAGAGTLLGTSPIGAAVIAGSAGLVAVTLAIKNHNQRLKEQEEILGQLGQEYRKYANIVNTASKGTSEYVEAAQQLQHTKERLVEVAPELILSFDEEGNVLAVNEEKLLRYADALDKVNEKRDKLADSKAKQLQEEIAVLNQHIALLERQPQQLSELVGYREKLIDAIKKGTSSEQEAQQVKNDLANIEKSIIDIVGEEGFERLKAAGFTEEAVNREVAAINRLRDAEKQAVIEKIKTRIEDTKNAIKESLERISIYEKEMKALGKPVRVSLIDYEGEVVIPEKPVSDALAKAIQQERLKREAKERELEALQGELADKLIQKSQESYGGLPAGTKPKGGGTGTAKSWSEIFGEELDRIIPPDLVRRSIQFSASLETLNFRLEILSTTEEKLNQKIKDGTATQEDYTRLQGVLTEKVFLLKQQQTLLAQANENLTKQLPYLNAELLKAEQRYEAMRKAGNLAGMRDANEAIKQARDAISSLNQEIHNNTIESMKAADAIANFKQVMDESRQKVYDQTRALMQHQIALRRMSVEQQIQWLRELAQWSDLTTEQRWRNEEELFDRYKESLDDQMDDIRKAYEERIKLIEEESNAQIEAIQRQIDALDEEQKDDERAEARRQFNEKIKALEEERQYHEIRTGIEHARRIAEIDKEIQEEKIRWELQQEEWAREDKKDALQKEIDDIKEATDKKKEELEDYYNDAIDLLNESTREMLASLAVENEKWYERGLEWAKRLIEGFKDGKPLDSILDEIEGGVGEAEEEEESRPDVKPPSRPEEHVAVIPSSMYVSKNNTAYMWSRTLGELLDKSVGWDGTNVIIGGKKFVPAWVDNGKTYVPIRQVAESLGYKVSWKPEGIVIDKAHTGAYVKSSGIAELLKGERVLSPRLTIAFDRLASVLSSIPNIPDRIAVAGGGNTIHIDTVLRTDRVEMFDSGDMEIAGRVIGRAIRSVVTARGG